MAPSPEPNAVLLDAGEPLEPPANRVGRRHGVVLDGTRDGRAIPVECWYPTDDRDGERAAYEILPGIRFANAALDGVAPRPAALPLIVWSHGRTGTRTSYTMLCEGLAARGYAVIAPDHPGDTLADWLGGTPADDETNHANRVGDVAGVVNAALAGAAPFAGITIDRERIAIAGHSYGGWTALTVAGDPHAQLPVRAVAGCQSLTRNIPRAVLEAVTVPTLLIVGALDATTPPTTDGDRAFALLRGTPDPRRLVVDRAGHQACSDTGLYVDLEPQVAGLPDVVRQLVRGLADQVTGTAGEPWRPVVALHLRALAEFFDEVVRDRAPASTGEP